MTREKVLEDIKNLTHDIDIWVDAYVKAKSNGDDTSLAGAQRVLNMYLEQARKKLGFLYDYIKENPLTIEDLKRLDELEVSGGIDEFYGSDEWYKEILKRFKEGGKE